MVFACLGGKRLICIIGSWYIYEIQKHEDNVYVHCKKINFKTVSLFYLDCFGWQNYNYSVCLLPRGKCWSFSEGNLLFSFPISIDNWLAKEVIVGDRMGLTHRHAMCCIFWPMLLWIRVPLETFILIKFQLPKSFPTEPHKLATHWRFAVQLTLPNIWLASTLRVQFHFQY